MLLRFRRASEMTDAEMSAVAIDADAAWFRQRRWALEAARLLHALDDAPDAGKAAAKEALSNHYRTRNDVETSRAP